MTTGHAASSRRARARPVHSRPAVPAGADNEYRFPSGLMKEFPAKLLAAGTARKIYKDYVRRNRDPALLEWLGTGMFQTSVFPVPPGAERRVTLRYSG